MKLPHFKRKIKKNPFKAIAIFIATIVAVFFITGAISQLFKLGIRQNDGFNNFTRISYSPMTIIENYSEYNYWPLFIITLTFLFIGFLIILFKEKDYYADARNFNISKKGTYGTSGWMQDEEIRDDFKITDIHDTDTTIFGRMKDGEEVVSARTEPEFEGDLRPFKFNKHIAVYGASGSGKSRTFVRPFIMQAVKREESMIIPDPSAELYESMAKYLEKEGYTIRVFNTQTPSLSDSWNPVLNVANAGENEDLMAQIFANTVIMNTIPPGSKFDHFWDNAEMSLLKALTLYIIHDPKHDKNSKNFGEVYQMLTTKSVQDISDAFAELSDNHPAKPAWKIVEQAGPNARGNVIIGLGSRLQVFQSQQIRKLTAHDDIDLVLPGKEKCAYFIIMSDQQSTFNFLSSLFFTFTFQSLVDYAISQGGRLPREVNLVLDEFPNIGTIPDFTKKISTVRKYGINISVIIQNIAQIKNRYPDNQWEEILGNCDTQLFLGCNDLTTAEYVSNRTGQITVEVESTSRRKQTGAIDDPLPAFNESSGLGKRMLLEPDEVLRFDTNYCLLMAQGEKILKLKKLDFEEHPDADKLVYQNIKDYVPGAKEKMYKQLNFLNGGKKKKPYQGRTIKKEAEPVVNEDAIEDDANQQIKKVGAKNRAKRRTQRRNKAAQDNI